MKSKNQIKTTSFALTIGWLYPDLMNIYGDRGNAIVLHKRCTWRGIQADVKEIGVDSPIQELESCDILLMGGAQDTQQTIVAKDLKKKKKVFTDMIENGTPGLYLCGGYQFLGKYYKEADGTIIEQLGLLDFYTENPGEQVQRCVGNIVIKINPVIKEKGFWTSSPRWRFGEAGKNDDSIVGFENHGGRTYLGKNLLPFGRVIKGFGNNGKDGTEGLLYKNTIASYLHGPLLPKNPEVGDWLIAQALAKKYKKTIELPVLDDWLAKKAKEAILSKI